MEHEGEMRESPKTPSKLADIPNDVAEAWSVLHGQILHALEGMERLLAETGRDRRTSSPDRHLLSHPTARKRIVLDFLSWCWCERPDDCHFGRMPQTIAAEYRLFVAWRDSIHDAGKKRIAFEIGTPAEYTACREGGRKAFRKRWAELQSARNLLAGNGPAERKNEMG